MPVQHPDWTGDHQHTTLEKLQNWLPRQRAKSDMLPLLLAPDAISDNRVQYVDNIASSRVDTIARTSSRKQRFTATPDESSAVDIWAAAVSVSTLHLTSYYGGYDTHDFHKWWSSFFRTVADDFSRLEFQLLPARRGTAIALPSTEFTALNGRRPKMYRAFNQNATLSPGLLRRRGRRKIGWTPNYLDNRNPFGLSFNIGNGRGFTKQIFTNMFRAKLPVIVSKFSPYSQVFISTAAVVLSAGFELPWFGLNKVLPILSLPAQATWLWELRAPHASVHLN
ncbi:hypothetical protein BD779DRAFT_1724590 [Infundibulicybe gibba]|nr:hypothetical protein BD779DRAFT_1724590 [Infundibulicybe gibba]